MRRLLERWAGVVVRHRLAVLALSIAASGLLAGGIAALRVDLDLQAQLPVDHPYMVADREIRQHFGGKNLVAIAVVPRDGTIWQPGVLEVIRALTAELLDAPGVIRQNVVSLSSPYVRVPEVEGGVLTSTYLMSAVPHDAAGVAALRARWAGEPLFRGTVVSRDERAAMVFADFDEATPAIAVARTVYAAVARHESPALRLAVAGAPVAEAEEAALMDRQAGYFGLTLAALLAVLYLAFGQFQGVVIPSLTALLSTACAMGVMGWAGIPLNTWTMCAPLMVVTIAAGHSAQMLKRYVEEYRRLGDRGAAIVSSTGAIGTVMLAAAAAAGSGFASLAVLGIPSLRHFGLGVASGIAAAVLLEMTFMLALRALWPTGARSAGEGPLSGALGGLLARFETSAADRPWRVMAGFAIAAVLSIAGYPRLTTDFVGRDYRSPHTQIGRDLPVFEEHFPDTMNLSILLEGEPGSMKSPEAVALMRGLTRVMLEEEGVGRASSVADLVDRAYAVFAPEEAARGPAERADLLAQLFFLAESPAFERYVDRAYGRAVVLGFLTRDESALTRRVLERIARHLAAHPPATIRVSLAGGFAPAVLALNEDTVRGKILNVALVLGVIVVVSSLLLRAVSGGAYMIAPLLMALVVNFGLFSWFGVAFDLVGATIVAISIGVGADYAIYFLFRLREEYGATGDVRAALHGAIESSGRAVLFVALAVSAGFAGNLPSDFLGMRLMGIFVPVTMVTSCVTSLTLLPAILVLRRPRFLFGTGEGGR